ncbi:MAG TPA: PilZ domain-containing protein [Allosphingosinicella sp.]|nr:PilZ domain-containing protein [Allosphingosinicella sp.]
MIVGNRQAPRKAPVKLPGDMERREDVRFHTVLRVALVTRAHDVGLWRVRNISDRGIMLATHVQLVPGERLTIGLSDAIAVDGRVVWWDGERCGVAFDEPIDCAAALHALVAEQRLPHYRPPRLTVATRAIAWCDKGLHTVRIYNLSHHGAAFTHDGCFHAGMPTKLHFETGEDYRGVVRWSEDGRAGLYLTDPIPSAKLESARRL